MGGGLKLRGPGAHQRQLRRPGRYQRPLKVAAILGLVASFVLIGRPLSATAAALGDITTFAGNHATGFNFGGDGGPATSASFFFPLGVVADGKGNVYISDTINAEVRKVDSSGTITAFAGDGGIARLFG